MADRAIVASATPAVGGLGVARRRLCRAGFAAGRPADCVARRSAADRLVAVDRQSAGLVGVGDGHAGGAVGLVGPRSGFCLARGLRVCSFGRVAGGGRVVSPRRHSGGVSRLGNRGNRLPRGGLLPKPVLGRGLVVGSAPRADPGAGHRRLVCGLERRAKVDGWRGVDADPEARLFRKSRASSRPEPGDRERAGPPVADRQRRHRGVCLAGHVALGFRSMPAGFGGRIGLRRHLVHRRLACVHSRRRGVVLSGDAVGRVVGSIVESDFVRRRRRTAAGSGRGSALDRAALGGGQRDGFGAPLVVGRLCAGHRNLRLDAGLDRIRRAFVAVAGLGADSGPSGKRRPRGRDVDRRRADRAGDDHRGQPPDVRFACRFSRRPDRLRPDGHDFVLRGAAAGLGSRAGRPCDPREENGLHAGRLGSAPIRDVLGVRATCARTVAELSD